VELERIREIRDDLSSRIPEFPYQGCSRAALELHRQGLEIILGWVKLNNYCGMGQDKNIPHYWNYDPKTGRHVCITASQFNIHLNEKLPEILIWKENEDNSIYVVQQRNIDPREMWY
jgi:hypothetical protein